MPVFIRTEFGNVTKGFEGMQRNTRTSLAFCARAYSCSARLEPEIQPSKERCRCHHALFYFTRIPSPLFSSGGYLPGTRPFLRLDSLDDGRQKALSRAEGAELKASFVSSHKEPSGVLSTTLDHSIPEVSVRRRLHRRMLWHGG